MVYNIIMKSVCVVSKINNFVYQSNNIITNNNNIITQLKLSCIIILLIKTIPKI